MREQQQTAPYCSQCGHPQCGCVLAEGRDIYRVEGPSGKISYVAFSRQPSDIPAGHTIECVTVQDEVGWLLDFARDFGRAAKGGAMKKFETQHLDYQEKQDVLISGPPTSVMNTGSGPVIGYSDSGEHEDWRIWMIYSGDEIPAGCLRIGVFIDSENRPVEVHAQRVSLRNIGESRLELLQD